MAQAANLLISIGGNPVIDDSSVIPTYPTTLPGKVLPGLSVTLQKATPKHIADVFMIIEFPDEVVDESAFDETDIDRDALTIGRFYKSLNNCMKKLYRKGKITFGHGTEQLYWPWRMHDKSSKLYKIDSMKAANKAISMIVEQGEGSKQMDPTYLKTEKLAHFFKFQELACKRHLKVTHEHRYSFVGEEIQFVPEGVWPMRDDPKSSTVPKESQVYHEAKIFHRMYRSLLKSIQTAFNGRPDVINDAVYIMESMQIQAKKLMKMEMPNTPKGHPKKTCGPIFDYTWEDEKESMQVQAKKLMKKKMPSTLDGHSKLTRGPVLSADYAYVREDEKKSMGVQGKKLKHMEEPDTLEGYPKPTSGPGDDTIQEDEMWETERNALPTNEASIPPQSTITVYSSLVLLLAI